MDRFVRPTGLVVSAPALVRAGAILPRDPEGQRLLRACVAEHRSHPDREREPWLPDFRASASSVLGWNSRPRDTREPTTARSRRSWRRRCRKAGRCCVPTSPCESATRARMRLREDAALHPDTMNQRYGAWSRLRYCCGCFTTAPRRTGCICRRATATSSIPTGSRRRRADLLRRPRRGADRFRLRDHDGLPAGDGPGEVGRRSGGERHGAPATVNLEALLAEPYGSRAKWLQEHADRKLTDRVKRSVQAADTVEQSHAALDPVLDAQATPDLVPAGAMVLQPSEERRRSGSRYTPRELTELIVRTALEPILARRADGEGRSPRPEAILDMKVCDPAMGSGAFLVEACRQLGEALIELGAAPWPDRARHPRGCRSARTTFGQRSSPATRNARTDVSSHCDARRARCGQRDTDDRAPCRETGYPP